MSGHASQIRFSRLGQARGTSPGSLDQRSSLFYALDALAHRALGGEALSQHVTHHVWHVRRLMWKHTLTAPWRQGDIILVDNFRSRTSACPTFSTAGERRLWAT